MQRRASRFDYHRSLAPAGWLRRQLELQAANCTAPLPDHWPDVGPDSAWLGGEGEDWERGPYYLDGLIPLAWLLDDAPLKTRAKEWVESILASRRSDGFFGPATNSDWWPRMIVLKALTLYAEFSGDSRIVPFLEGYFRYQALNLPEKPLDEWSVLRSSDNIEAALWLQERTGREDHAGLIAELQRQSADWEGFFGSFPYTGAISGVFAGIFGHGNPAAEKVAEIAERIPWYHHTHGVNAAMGLKFPTVLYLISGERKYLELFNTGRERLLAYHGTAGGVFTGDEHLGGLAPEAGVETCTVVEYMAALESAFRISSEPGLWDLIERAAFNSLAAALSSDLRVHQYFQQDNQFHCRKEPGPWYNGTEDSNLFGLEPNFGCCTANQHQGWPRFAASAWGVDDGGRPSLFSYVPASGHFTTDAYRLGLEVAGEYPFADTVLIRVTERRGRVPALRLRIPGWCSAPDLQRNGAPLPHSRERGWALIDTELFIGDEIRLSLPRSLTRREFTDGSYCFDYGPLVMVLPGEERWRRRGGSDAFPEYEVLPLPEARFPRPAPQSFEAPHFGTVSDLPFAGDAPPIRIPTDQGVLVPYGCARIRQARFLPDRSTHNGPRKGELQ